MRESFDSSVSAYGLDSRFLYWGYAIEQSQSLFDIKGYKNLLYRYEFSSHNEFLGHTSATGILPAIAYFTLLFILFRNRLNRLKKVDNLLLYKLVLAMVISYLIVGLTENIYISNTMWMYLFLFVIGLSTSKSKNDQKTNTTA
jgi:O-antigen ligase